MKLLKFINAKLYSIVDVAAWILAAALCLLVGFQVLNRFILHIPAPWTEEFSRYAFVWLVMIGSAKATYNRQHLKIEILALMVRQERAKIFINLLANACVLFFFGVLAYQSVFFCLSGFNRTAISFRLPMFYVYIVFPLAFALMFLFDLQNFLDDIKKLFKSQREVA